MGGCWGKWGGRGARWGSVFDPAFPWLVGLEVLSEGAVESSQEFDVALRDAIEEEGGVFGVFLIELYGGPGDFWERVADGVWQWVAVDIGVEDEVEVVGAVVGAVVVFGRLDSHSRVTFPCGRGGDGGGVLQVFEGCGGLLGELIIEDEVEDFFEGVGAGGIGSTGLW